MGEVELQQQTLDDQRNAAIEKTHEQLKISIPDLQAGKGPEMQPTICSLARLKLASVSQ